MSTKTAYCVKCKSKKEMKGAHEASMANGRRALKGSCVTCGTRMNVFLGKAGGAAKAPPKTAKRSEPLPSKTGEENVPPLPKKDAPPPALGKVTERKMGSNGRYSYLVDGEWKASKDVPKKIRESFNRKARKG